MNAVTEYYIIAKEALPSVFLKVIEAKKLIEGGKCKTASEAFRIVGISRSTYYRYKDLISPFYENNRQSTITIAFNLEHTPGYLSGALNAVAKAGANILTINQTIPINGIANITLTVDTMETGFIEELRKVQGVRALKILARE